MGRLVRYAIVVSAVFIALIWGLFAYVSGYADPFIYETIREVPPKRAALVLGTSKYIAKGKPNAFYRYRIEAAAALWKAKKIKAIVVSGDNATRYYNETQQMYRDLIKAGVPARYITRDFAGFRTLDSVMRAGKDFGLDDYIIVSQPFHLARALYIAHAKGHRAIGFAAKQKHLRLALLKMYLREAAARVKMVIDLYLLGTKPKYYGGKHPVRYKDT